MKQQQIPSLSLSQPSSLARKSKDPNASAAAVSSSQYQTSFANRDMNVNKKYAKFQERFGPANTNQSNDPSEIEVAPLLKLQEEILQDAQANNNHRRIEEEKKSSKSPELMDDMMESTGMQRSSAKFSPPQELTTQPAQPRSRGQWIQQRMQNLNNQLTGSGQQTPVSQEEQKQASSKFQGSFQRATQITQQAQHEYQTERSVRGSQLLREHTDSRASLNVSANSPSQNTTQSIPASQNHSQQRSNEGPSMNSSQSRLRIKLADYLSPASGQQQKQGTPQGIQRQSPRQSHASQESTVSVIKLRQYARKLFNAVDSSWIPSLKRIQVDAFDTIKNNDIICIEPVKSNYSSVQTFGDHRKAALSGANLQMMLDGATTNRTEQTAQFVDEGNEVAKNYPQIEQSQSQKQLTTSQRNNQLNKQKFIVEPNQQNNWRLTSPKIVNSPTEIKKANYESVAPLVSSPSPEKKQFNFEQLETIQNNKFQKLNAIMNINDHSQEEQNNNNFQQEMLSQGSSENNLVSSESGNCRDQIKDGFPDDTQQQDTQEPYNTNYVEQIQYDIGGPPLSNDSMDRGDNHQGSTDQEKQSMMSPIQSARDGFQYPQAVTQSVYYNKNHKNGVQSKTTNPRFNIHKTQPNFGVTSDGNTSSLQEGILHHEVGEGPVSAHPTEFTQDSQWMCMSNQDFKTKPFDDNKSSNNPIRILDRSPPPTFKNAPNMLEVAEMARSQNNAEVHDVSSSQGIGPMKIEYLDYVDQYQKPSTIDVITEQPQLNKIPSPSSSDYGQKIIEKEEVQQSITVKPPLNKFNKLPQMAQSMVTGSVHNHGIGAGAVEQKPHLTSVSQSFENSIKSKIEKIQPLLPILHGDMLAKANKVNQEVSDKIAKIKAMQEELLRPRTRVESKSSVRSGRQMSDHDYNKLTQELGMSIQLRKVTASETASELDILSDRGTEPFNGGASATEEYFAAPNSQINRKRKVDIQRSAKRSTDFKTGQNLLLTATEQIQSPLLQSSVDVAQNIGSVASPISEQPKFKQQLRVNSELDRLKMQNGLLIMSKRFNHYSTIAKQVFLARWRNKVQSQKQVMTKMLQIALQKQDALNSLQLKQSLQDWKAFKDMQLQIEMDEELQAVLDMQETMLGNIQTYISDKRIQRIKTRCFNAILKFSSKNKEIKQKKTQGCTRLGRVLRRLLHKRFRNSWKAMNQLPFVSDLADEEVFSILSGAQTHKTTANNSIMRSPMSRLLPGRSASARMDDQSPRTRNGISPMGYTEMTSISNKSQAEFGLAKIKGGVKLLTISVGRQLKQTQKPALQDLFTLWKARAHFMRTNLQEEQKTPIPQPSDTNNNKFLGDLPITQDIGQIKLLQQHSSSAQQSIVTIPRSFVENSDALPETTAKQNSFKNSSTNQLEGVYKPANRSIAVTPDHEVRPEMLAMLEQDANPSEQQLNTKQRASIVTTSDISSVELDSDDSCFAATVEVIKLAPVRKNRESMDTAQSQQHLLQNSQYKVMDEHMPSTTNVSQIGNDNLDGPLQDSPFKPPVIPLLSDQDKCDQQILMNIVDNTAQSLRGTDEDQYEETNKSMKSTNYQPGQNPPQSQPKKLKLKKQSFKPTFNNFKMVPNALYQPGRQSIPTPRQKTTATTKPLPQQKIQQRKNSRSKIPQETISIEPRRRNQINTFYPKQAGSSTNCGRAGLRQKSNSSKHHKKSTPTLKSAMENEPFKKDIDTPQFRGSLVSNRKKSQEDVPDHPYYEMENANNLQKNLSKPKQTKVIHKQHSNQTSIKQQDQHLDKQKLILSLAKVAEAQIQAEVAMQSELKREKSRSLCKQQERKTSLLFQKKNLSGINSQLTSPQQINKAANLLNSQQTSTSQLLANMSKQQYSQTPSTRNQRKPQHSHSHHVKIPPTGKSNKVLTKNNLSEKAGGSFVSQEYSRGPQQIPNWAVVQQSSHRSQMVSPKGRRSVSKKSVKPRRTLSTAQATPNNRNIAKVDVEACLTNSLRVKMPHLQLASVRNSDLTSRSQHNHYSQMSMNPFQKAPLQQSKTRKNNSSTSRNLMKNNSKSSLHSISDRPLRTTYEPPASFARAFRRRSNQRNHDNSQQNLHTQQEAFAKLDYEQQEIHSAKNNLQHAHHQQHNQQEVTNFGDLQTQQSYFDHIQRDQVQQQEQLQDPQESSMSSNQRSTNIVVTGTNEEDHMMARNDTDASNQHVIQVDQIDADTPEIVTESHQQIVELRATFSGEGKQLKNQQQNEEEQEEFYEQVQTTAEKGEKTMDSENYQWAQTTPNWVENAKTNVKSDVQRMINSEKQGREQDLEEQKMAVVGNQGDLESPQKTQEQQLQDNQYRKFSSVQSHGENMRERVKMIRDSNQFVASDEYENGAFKHVRASDEVLSSSNGGTNFTLGAASPQQENYYENQPQVMQQFADRQIQEQTRRETFGREPQQIVSQEYNQNSVLQQLPQQLQPNAAEDKIVDNSVLQQVESGLGRLSRALTPRLERYKVELFIHLCEMLDEEEEDEDEYIYEGDNGENGNTSDDDEDVYGSSNYMRPKNFNGQENYLNQQKQQHQQHQY